MPQTSVELDKLLGARLLRLHSEDGTNRLTRNCVVSITATLTGLKLHQAERALIITGNDRFFSAGAELEEIAALSGPAAFDFARLGQRLMAVIQHFPVPVYAAISGYCLGGGLDLALACRRRIAAPNAVFGHRGAALGLITGWGGTQRLPRLVGKGLAVAMFSAAEKVNAKEALRIGLVDQIADDPVSEVLLRLTNHA